jgi:hypothetical protein
MTTRFANLLYISDFVIFEIYDHFYFEGILILDFNFIFNWIKTFHFCHENYFSIRQLLLLIWVLRPKNLHYFLSFFTTYIFLMNYQHFQLFKISHHLMFTTKMGKPCLYFYFIAQNWWILRQVYSNYHWYWLPISIYWKVFHN